MARRASAKKKTRKKAKASSSPRSPRARRSRKKLPEGEPDRGGRPAIEWTPEIAETVGALSKFGNTVADIAQLLKVSKASLEAAVSDESLPIRAAYYGGKAQLNRSLRRAQVRSALGTKADGSAGDGNVTAQIWLGKQTLGQRDVRAIEVSGGDEPLKLEADLGPVVERKVEEFLRSRGRS